MQFGLTNTLATFQGLMNAICSKILRKFLLVFFDDILVYSKSEVEHVQHLRHVLSCMRANHLLGVNKVEYLWHLLFKDGVSTDHVKIQVVKD